MIVLDHLSKTYVGSAGAHEALRDINLHVEPGDVFGIIGQSGAGKSTLVRCINLLERPTAGRVLIDGTDVTDYSGKQLIDLRQSIGMIFQNFSLFAQRTVLRNVTFPLELHGTPKKQAEARALELLELVGLSGKANNYPSQLSGGQQQRVAIARALVNNPAIICLDEPLSNLDAKLRSDMRTELIQLHEELKSTFIYVTHDQIEAMTMGTNIVVMNEGRVMQQGSPTEIHNDPNCVFVAQFVGDPGMNIVAAGDYQVGFRPRDVEFDCADRDEEHVVIRRRVRSFENHGSEFLYLLDTPEKVFVKELSKRQRPLNEPFTVRIHRDDLYVFGRDGKRIYASEEVAKAYAEFKRNWQSV